MLNYGDLLNRNHPLNQGLRYYQKVLPGELSGALWRNHAYPIDSDAAMTNLGSGGVQGKSYARAQWAAPSPTLGFSPTTRLGGFGEMRTDATSNAYLKAGAGHMFRNPSDGGYNGALTLAGWCYTTSTASGFYYIIGTGTSSGSLLQCLGRHGTSAIHACFGNDNEVANVFATTYQYAHLVATYDGSASGLQHQNLYINGALGVSATRSLNPTNADTDVEFGGFGGGSLWLGGFDDLRIYDRALSAQEVAWLYHEGFNYQSDMYNKVDLGDLFIYGGAGALPTAPDGYAAVIAQQSASGQWVGVQYV